jgi:hypothetical protein
VGVVNGKDPFGLTLISKLEICTATHNSDNVVAVILDRCK